MMNRSLLNTLSKQAIFALVLMFLLIGACDRRSESTIETGSDAILDDEFNLANSDPAAVELADSIIDAYGGAEAWNKIRFISWRDSFNQFYWDKSARNIRVANAEEVSIINTRTRQGRVWRKGVELKDSVIVKERVAESLRTWRESAAIIFLPFLLKQKDMSLKYLGEERVEDNRSNVLEVSDTNDKTWRYLVHASLENNRIIRSDFFPERTDEFSLTLQYDHCKTSSDILICVPEHSDITELEVGASLPEKLFYEL